MATGKYNSIDSKEQLILVQTREGRFGGYKQDLLVNTLNELEIEIYVCTRCKGVMLNACQVGEEQICVCETCVGKKVRFQPMMKARQKIPQLKANCPLATRGCKWNATLSEVVTHLDVCQEFLVKCDYDCGVILKRCELNNHCSSECLNREVSCEHCLNKTVYRYLKRHYEECLEFPLLCPNSCGANLRRKQTDSHIETDCPNTIVKCRYERFGCKVVIKRCELEEHNKTNEIEHLKMNTIFAVTRMAQLEETNKLLFSQMSRTIEEQSAIIESISYPVVLRDIIRESYMVENWFLPLAKFETSWRFINLTLVFGNIIEERIPISLKFNKLISPLARCPFEGRFKLTIIGRINTVDSLVFESPVVKLQKRFHKFDIVTMPMKLILEDRFKTEKGEIEFTLQKISIMNICCCCCLHKYVNN